MKVDRSPGTEYSGVSLYVGSDVDAVHSIIASKLTPSPRTLVVTMTPSDWALHLSNTKFFCEKSTRSNIRQLHKASHIKIIEPDKLASELEKGRIFYQILCDSISLTKFNNENLSSTLSSVLSLTKSSGCHIIFSVIANNLQILEGIEQNIRGTGILNHDGIACWLVARGNLPVRYFRFSQRSLASCVGEKNNLSPAALLPTSKLEKSYLTNPFIEVTTL